MVAASVNMASPANLKLSSEHFPALSFPAPHVSSTTTGM